MQEMDARCLAAVLRRKLHSGNEAQVAQAAFQAIEQLERSSSQFALPSESNSGLDDVNCPDETSETSSSQNRHVSSQQVHHVEHHPPNVRVSFVATFAQLRFVMIVGVDWLPLNASSKSSHEIALTLKV